MNTCREIPEELRSLCYLGHGAARAHAEHAEPRQLVDTGKGQKAAPASAAAAAGDAGDATAGAGASLSPAAAASSPPTRLRRRARRRVRSATPPPLRAAAPDLKRVDRERARRREVVFPRAQSRAAAGHPARGDGCSARPGGQPAEGRPAAAVRAAAANRSHVQREF